MISQKDEKFVDDGGDVRVLSDIIKSRSWSGGTVFCCHPLQPAWHESGVCGVARAVMSDDQINNQTESNKCN